MRGHSKESDAYSDMNIPLTSNEGQFGGSYDNHHFGHPSNNSNTSIDSHGNNPYRSSDNIPLTSTHQKQPSSTKVHRAPTAFSNFISNFTGGSTANQEGIRIIYLNNPERNAQSKYLHNRISTSKYNYFTFLPKFLYEQFSKYANVFFLFTACIQVTYTYKETS